MAKDCKHIRTQRSLDAYRAAADELALIFLHQLGLGDAKDYDWWWISDEAKDTLCFCGGEQFVSMEEVMLVIEHGMARKEFEAWYWQWHDYEKGKGRKPGRVNLRSWIMGARPCMLDGDKQGE